MENLSQELEFLDLGGLSESEKCLLQDVLLLNLAPVHNHPEAASEPEEPFTLASENGEFCQGFQPEALSEEPGRGMDVPSMEGMNIPVTVAYAQAMPPNIQMYSPSMVPTSIQHYQPVQVNYLPMLSGAHHHFGSGPNFYVNNMTANVNVNNAAGPFMPQHRMTNAQSLHYIKRKNVRPKYIKKDPVNGHMGHDVYSPMSMYPHGSFVGPCFPGSLVQAATGVPFVMHQQYMQPRNTHVPASGSNPVIYPTTPVAAPILPEAEMMPEYSMPEPLVQHVPELAEEAQNVVQEVAVDGEQDLPEIATIDISLSQPTKVESCQVEIIETPLLEEAQARSPTPVQEPTPVVAVPSPVPEVASPSALPAPAAAVSVAAEILPVAPKSWASLFKNSAAALNVTAEKPTARVEPFSPASDKKTEVHGPTLAPVLDDSRRNLAKHLISYEMLMAPIALMPRGLTNKNNYCYINATLQALIACPPFVHLVKSLSNLTGIRAGQSSHTPIIDSVVEFVGQFETVPVRSSKDRAASKKEDPYFGTSFEPNSLYKMLSKIRSETFKVEGRQEDAEEFLSCLLNGLHDEMIEVLKFSEDEAGQETAARNVALPNPTTEDEDWQVIGPKNRGCVTRSATYSKTPISNLFLGLMRSALHHAGAQSTATLQPFFSLQLDIQNEKVNSVREALECLVSKEPLTGYVCSKTGQEVDASRQTTLEELPPILILHLKCFVYDKSGGCQKLLKRIDFTSDLDLSKDLLSPVQKGKVKEKQRHYKLFAVVYHDGKEATKGHYVTEVKHEGVGSWLRFDDSIVRTVNDGQLFKYNMPRMPYLLLYRRADTFSAAVARPAASTTPSAASSSGRKFQS